MNANGCKTHIVIKIDDAKAYLTKDQISQIEKCLEDIQKGRIKDGKVPVNRYFICNEDEPYAKTVEDMILAGEAQKKTASTGRTVSSADAS